MEDQPNLPFRVGDEAEIKSFVEGFRGAWFRCKVAGIRVNEGAYEHYTEYLDFPDERMKWEKMYEVVPYPVRGRSGDEHKELMLRPSYPPILYKEQMGDAGSISQVSVIVNRKWKVGDLVDWWTDNSYWTAHITAILSDDKAQIELLRPPLGEGSFYEAFLKDVRPSLQWSPKRGWQLPPQRKSRRKPCASLVKPASEVSGRRRPKRTHQEADAAVEAISSNLVSNSDDAEDTHPSMSKDSQEATKFAPGESTNTTSAHASACVVETRVQAEGAMACNRDTPDKTLALRPSQCDSAEAAVTALQRCLNRVKHLRALILNRKSSPVGAPPRWKFVLPDDPYNDPDIPRPS